MRRAAASYELRSCSTTLHPRLVTSIEQIRWLDEPWIGGIESNPRCDGHKFEALHGQDTLQFQEFHDRVRCREVQCRNLIIGRQQACAIGTPLLASRMVSTSIHPFIAIPFSIFSLSRRAI